MQPTQSQIEHNPPDFHAWFCEIDQQTKAVSCSLQIIEALGAMHIIQGPYRFDFDENLPIDQEVNDIFTNDDTVVPDINSSLLYDRQT